MDGILIVQDYFVDLSGVKLAVPFFKFSVTSILNIESTFKLPALVPSQSKGCSKNLIKNLNTINQKP